MNILANATLFLMLFPWVSFGILDLDTQPWSMIMASIFFILNLRKKLHVSIFLSLFLVLFSFLVGVAYGQIDFLFIRAVFSYFSFFVVLASYYIIKRHYCLSMWIIVSSNFIWLCAGFLQLVFGKHVLSFLVHVRTTDDRGVTGLAPEPTFYGIFLFFISWVLYLERERISCHLFRSLFFLNVVFIFFVAKSSMVILFCLVAVFLYVVINFLSLKKVLIAVIAFSSSLLLLANFSYLVADTRVYKLAMILKETPFYIVTKDASINERASHIFFSFKGFIVDFALPHGFHEFSNALILGRSDSNGFFWWGAGGNKVMSGVGGMLFELGWFSFPFFMLVCWLMFSRANKKYSLYFLVLLLVVFVSAIPISFTLLPMAMVSTYFYFQSKPSLVRCV